MPNVSHIEKGAILVMESRPYHGARRTESKVEEVEVVKVGRDYIYVQPREQARYLPLRFRRDTGNGINGEHSSGHQLFQDFGLYEKHKARQKRITTVSQLLTGTRHFIRNWDGMTDDELDSMTTQLKKLNGEPA